VYEVPLDVWVAGWNITGANLLLDDLFKYLVEEQR
jgi:ABC-type Fe3+-hydroxamate transport system substrate-binding protein